MQANQSCDMLQECKLNISDQNCNVTIDQRKCHILLLISIFFSFFSLKNMLKSTVGFRIFKIALEAIILEPFSKFNIQIYHFKGLTYCHISDSTGL